MERSARNHRGGQDGAAGASSKVLPEAKQPDSHNPWGSNFHPQLETSRSPATSYNSATPRVLLNFQHYGNLSSVHFIEADCRTLTGAKTRYYHFATLDGLRSFVIRCNPENMPEFERSLRAWSRGSNHVNHLR